MPAIYHEGSWLGNATDPEVLVKDTVGWTGKNRAYSQTNNAVIAHIENGITYDVSWTGSTTVTLKKNSASGATITSGSTSPLSFTADADYELYFGSSATVTNIMVKDSRITDPTYEPYHESVEEEIEQVYADNGVLGAKNLLPNNVSTRTLGGITFTVNSDGSITWSGTHTGDGNIFLYLTNKMPIAKGSYILSGCPQGGSETTFNMGCALYDKNNVRLSYGIDTGSGVNIVVPSDGCTVDIYGPRSHVTNKGNTVSGTFYPMLRLASDPDDTYQPYAMTNRELTEKKADDICGAGTHDLTQMIVASLIPANAYAPEFFIPWNNPQKKRPTFNLLKVYDRTNGSWTELEQSDAPNIQRICENGFFTNVVLTNPLTSNSEKLLKIECKLTFS